MYKRQVQIRIRGVRWVGTLDFAEPLSVARDDEDAGLVLLGRECRAGLYGQRASNHAFGISLADQVVFIGAIGRRHETPVSLVGGGVCARTQFFAAVGVEHIVLGAASVVADGVITSSADFHARRICDGAIQAFVAFA